jgi:O-antigen/teichoic acid export membrane protein
VSPAQALSKLASRNSIAALWGIFNSFTLKGVAVVMSFGLITLAARVLGGHDFGTFSILFSVAGLFSVIGTAGQQVLLMRSWNEYSAQQDAPRLKGALLFGFFAAGLGSLLTALLVWLGLLFFYSGPLALATASYLFILSFALISAHLTRTAVGVAAGDGLANFLHTIFAIIYLILCAFGQTTPDLTMLLALLAIGKALTFIAHAALLWRRVGHNFPGFLKVEPIFETRVWRTRSLKLWLSNGLESANQYLDVLIVGLLMSPTIAGAYFVTTRLANAFAIASDAMHWYASRHIPDHYYRGEKQKLAELLNSVASINLAILTVGMSVVALAGHWLLYVFNPDYQTYYPALVLLCLGTAAVTAVGPSNSILMFTGHEGTTLKINAATIILRALGFFILVPLFDVTGAVVASTISFWMMALLLRNAAVRLSGIDGSITRLLPNLAPPLKKTPAE